MSPDSTPTNLPRWARVLDYLVLALLLLATVVALSGGFRTRLGPLSLSLTSPGRLMIWAALATLIRHLLAPRHPIYRDLPASVRAAWRTEPARAAFSAWVGTRLAIFFVGYLAVFMFGFGNGRAPWRVSENEFANLQARFDAGWYLGIAVEGYKYTPGNAQAQQNIVFFPAYPLLMRVTGRLFGGSPPAYMLGGTFVSLVAFFGALAYLFRFARGVLGDDDRAHVAVWMLAAYPFALFYGAVYTESLFLLGSLGAFWHFQRREFWKAAAWAILVSLTRPNGCFLAIPLGILAITPWLPAWIAGGSRDVAEDQRRAWSAGPFLVACAPVIGIVLQSMYMWQLTGNPLAWAEAQVAWGRSYEGLTTVFSDRYTFITESGVYEYTSQRSNDLLQLLGVVFVLTAAWPVARRFGLAYSLFILVNILPPLAAGGLLSAGRFSAVLFPAFVWLASVIPVHHRQAWLTSFMAVQAFNAALFYSWRFMY